MDPNDEDGDVIIACALLFCPNHKRSFQPLVCFRLYCACIDEGFVHASKHEVCVGSVHCRWNPASMAADCLLKCNPKTTTPSPTVEVAM